MLKLLNIKYKNQIFLIVVLFILLTVAGYSVLAQDSENVQSERIENDFDQTIPINDDI